MSDEPKLVETKEGAQATIDARESHEGQTEQAGADEHDGHSTHALGDVGQLQLFAYAGKDGQRQSEAESCGEGIHDALC